MMSELVWQLGDRGLSNRLRREAAELKKRFVDAFWMPDKGYLAMALDADKRPLRSIASNAGHCMATGIIEREMAVPIAGRLISEELFSGWGVRTLSIHDMAGSWLERADHSQIVNTAALVCVDAPFIAGRYCRSGSARSDRWRCFRGRNAPPDRR